MAEEKIDIAALEAEHKAAQEAEWKVMEDLAPLTAKRQEIEDKIARAKADADA